jgi:Ca2+/Na+ antiporter
MFFDLTNNFINIRDVSAYAAELTLLFGILFLLLHLTFLNTTIKYPTLIEYSGRVSICIPNQDMPLYKKLFQIRKRGLTTLNNNKSSIKFQEGTPKSIKTFIVNKNKQQEWLLFFYFFFLLGICFFIVPDLYALALAVFIIGCVFSTIFFLEYVSIFIKKVSFGNNAILFGFGFTFLAVLLYFQRYVSIALYISLVFYFYLKKTYTTKNNDQEKPNFVLRYLTHLDVVDYHYKKEFSRFYFLQRYNVFLFIFYVLSKHFDETSHFCTELWSNELFVRARFIVFIVCLFNFGLLQGIQYIIMYYCNVIPLEKKVLLGASTAVAVYFGISEVVDRSTTNPMGTPIDKVIQKIQWGHTVENVGEIEMRNEYLKKMTKPIPLTTSGGIDMEQCRTDLETAEFEKSIRLRERLHAYDATVPKLPITSSDKLLENFKDSLK